MDVIYCETVVASQKFCSVFFLLSRVGGNNYTFLHGGVFA